MRSTPPLGGHEPDAVVDTIARYVSSAPDWHAETLRTAGLCLADALACALGALGDPECVRLLGPAFDGYDTVGGVPVPGTGARLDPLKAAFDIGTTIRWLDFSDTTFVGGHPSDNIGGILAAASHASHAAAHSGRAPPTMRGVLDAMIKAYEIQGMLAAENRFDRPQIGLDHVIGVKIASAAVCAHLLGGDQDTVRRAVSNAWLDGQALNAYRHTPNAGTRKGWAGADATCRGLWLAQMATRGEMGYPYPLSAPTWGFEAVHLHGEPVRLASRLGSFVLDQVIFKLYPCQRNATTAVESAIALRPWLDGRIAEIDRIVIHTQDEALRRIDKTGPLANRAARDHCLQYVTAVALLKGSLESEDYSDTRAADPWIDWLRERMVVVENPQYSRDHHDIAVRSCANAVQIVLNDGETSLLSETAYPIGDPSRRHQAKSRLAGKFETLTRPHWSSERASATLALLLDPHALQAMPVDQFMTRVSRA